MKLYFKEKIYKHWSGLTLEGPGEVTVPKEMGEYLLQTFPKWFETKERKRSRQIKKENKSEDKK